MLWYISLIIAISAIIAFILLIVIMRCFYFNRPYTQLTHSMIGKTIIVTGCNTGIGKETAIELIRQGARVIFACRDENKAQAVIDQIKPPLQKDLATFIKLDLSSFISIENFVEKFKTEFNKLDILINNAGAFFDDYSTKEGNIETTLMTNHIGVVYLTSLLINSINDEGRVINVGSYAHTFINQEKFNNFTGDLIRTQTSNDEQNNYSSWNSYGFSKLGNLFHAQHLDLYLKNNKKSIKAVCLHPGAVISDLPRSKNCCTKFLICTIVYLMQIMFFKTALVGAQTTLNCAYMDYDSLVSGGYYKDCNIEKISIVAQNQQNMHEMMDFTGILISNSKKEKLPEEVREYLKINKIDVL